jgi:PPOX class probable F420-dependent enzyme
MTSTPAGTGLDELSSAKYVSLTSYRRDGTPVTTPVWVVRDGDHLAVWTNSRTGKVKRIRRNPAATLARCTFRGRLLSEPVPVRAELMPADDTLRVLGLIRRKYGFSGWILVYRARRNPLGSIGIRISPSTPAAPPSSAPAGS